MRDYKQERIGEIRNNTQGYPMKIIEYNSSGDIIVEFLDDYHYHKRTSYGNFCSGKIENRGAPTVLGIGILGTRPTWDSDKKCKTKEYIAWVEMLRRCYDKNGKFPSYSDVSVVNEWHLYDNFYDWVQGQENHNINNWKLDKDIIKKNNRIYSPDGCCLVPNRVNCLFEKLKSKRWDSPIGSTYNKKYGLYRVCCRGYNSENVYLGSYDNKEDAFYVYKQFKEKLIKRIAKEEYDKKTITYKCYISMMNYEIEIDD